MAEITTAIDIDAPVATVWRVLMEFDAYPEWNPFIRSIAGAPEPGAQLDVTLGASGKKPMRFRPTVQESSSNEKFSWLGTVGFAGLFDGYHQFDLHPTESGTRLEHHEQFSGILAPMIVPALRTSTRRGFEEMNTALKERAEAA